MILVMLGTQDKSFVRLLKAVDKAKEKGIIKEKVIVQAGYTKYTSKNMDIFDYTSHIEMNKLIDEASLIITHGGVASILEGLTKGKKIIAASRLSEYKEHTNDHQKQIVKEFSKEGYILELKDFNSLDKVLTEAKTFTPKKYKSNNKKFVKLIDNYIETDNHISWYNKYREIIIYVFFGVLTTIVNILVFFILDKLNVNVYLNNTIAWIVSVLFAFITNKLFVFESRDKSSTTVIKELVYFAICHIASLGVDMLTIYVCLSLLVFSKLLSKVIANIIVMIINYALSKLFVFGGKNYENA